MANRTASATITFDTEKPTTLTFKQLHHWVIWQIPTPVESGLSGAVKPSKGDQNWYPAIIDVKKENVQVYAHLDELFESPEAASAFLTKMS